MSKTEKSKSKPIPKFQKLAVFVLSNNKDIQIFWTMNLDRNLKRNVTGRKDHLNHFAWLTNILKIFSSHFLDSLTTVLYAMKNFAYRIAKYTNCPKLQMGSNLYN